MTKPQANSGMSGFIDPHWHADAPGRLNGSGPIAVMDIGSNSVRLVVYERRCRAPTVLFNEKVLAGLGKGINQTGKLAENSVDVAIAAARRFRMLADQCQAKEFHILATAASRDAANGAAFIAEIERICRVDAHILTGAEEARMAALGVVAGIHRPDGVAGDLGGGSLELIDVSGERIGAGRTYPLGGIRLSEAALGSLRKAEKIAADALEKSDILAAVAGRSFYAVGGTWRSLARLDLFQRDYPLHVMHNYSVPAADMAEFCRTVSRGDLETLSRIEVISRQRRDLLGYGAVVLGQIIRLGKPKEIVLSALGLREGHLYGLLDAEERAKDPLIVAAQELSLLRARDPRHGVELAAWTGKVMAAMGFSETEDEARLRVAACHLADIGWRTHPDYRGEQSLNIVANGAFVGVDHASRAFLALAVFYRHMGLIDDALSPRLIQLVPQPMRDRARALGSAQRVAMNLSAGMCGHLPEIGVERRGNAVVIVLPRRLADLDGDVVIKRLKQLTKLIGLEGAVEVAA